MRKECGEDLDKVKQAHAAELDIVSRATAQLELRVQRAEEIRGKMLVGNDAEQVQLAYPEEETLVQPECDSSDMSRARIDNVREDAKAKADKMKSVSVLLGHLVTTQPRHSVPIHPKRCVKPNTWSQNLSTKVTTVQQLIARQASHELITRKQ